MRHNIMRIATQEDGGNYAISIGIPLERGWIEQEKVKFHIWKFSEKRIYDMHYKTKDEKYAYFETEVYLESCPLYHYYFSFEVNGETEYVKHEYVTGPQNITREECFKMSVNFNVPDWAKGAVVYQIFPDRFCRGKNSTKEPMPRRRIHENWEEKPILESDPNYEDLYNNDFFGGDFAGIIEKIPYIANLGVDIVYLNPIVRSQSTHRYDAADYFQPDPYLGTVEELKHMIEEFHKYGIRVIFDAVFNHTGNDSIYFNQYGTYDSVGAYQSEDSPYKDMYERDKEGKFIGWWNYRNLPVCNKNNPDYINMICGVGGVIDRWFSWGIDGIRADVIDELPDFFIMEMNKAMQRNRPNDFLFILEVWDNVMRKGKTYISSGKEGHSPMNYFFMDAYLRYYMYKDTYKLERVCKEIHTEYPTETCQTLMNSTSTHDTSRLIDFFTCDRFDFDGLYAWDIDWEPIYKERAEMLYEEKCKWLEKGVTEEKAEDKAREKVRNEWQKEYKITKEQYENAKKIIKSYVTGLAFLPGMFTIFAGDEAGVEGIGTMLNRATYPWGHEDKEIFKFFIDLIKSRKSQKFLKEADVKFLEIKKEYFLYERYDNNNKIIVISSNVNNEINIPEKYHNAKILFSIGGNSNNTLSPYGAIVLKVE